MYYFVSIGAMYQGRGVIYDNNLTHIKTEHEWYPTEQIMFSSQAIQVFYIPEPFWGIDNHRWVIENVNHHKIWDLPFNNARVKTIYNGSVQNPKNGLHENVDVVHNNSSLNFTIEIDFL